MLIPNALLVLSDPLYGHQSLCWVQKFGIQLIIWHEVEKYASHSCSNETNNQKNNLPRCNRGTMLLDTD